jgi:phosphatidylinositol phospholipase C, beta
MYKYVEGIFK